MSVQLLSTLPTGGAVQLMISAANKSAETDLLLKKNTISQLINSSEGSLYDLLLSIYGFIHPLCHRGHTKDHCMTSFYLSMALFYTMDGDSTVLPQGGSSIISAAGAPHAIFFNQGNHQNLLPNSAIKYGLKLLIFFFS